MSTPSDSRVGQVALITGGNTGIGRVAARELTRRGFHVFVACRSAERARLVLDEARAAGGNNSIELLPLDLADFESVRTCARLFLDRGLPLHVLIIMRAWRARNETGRYYDNRRLKQPSALAQDSALAAELWRRSESWMS